MTNTCMLPSHTNNQMNWQEAKNDKHMYASIYVCTHADAPQVTHQQPRNKKLAPKKQKALTQTNKDIYANMLHTSTRVVLKKCMHIHSQRH